MSLWNNIAVRFLQTNNANLPWRIGLPVINVKERFCSTRNATIIIPKRVDRGPTDILQALANTVQRDVTAPHYKFHDDPFLTPVSNTSKRAFAMAQEAGRKAAKWIRNEHSELFQHRVADPFIDPFAPADKLKETTIVDEKLLRKFITTTEVGNAIQVYKMLEANNTPISVDTRQAFLELLCFFNEEEPLNEDLIEERWFKAGMKGKERPRKTWKQDGLAEKIFHSIEVKTAEPYCALIRGMATYGQVEGAWEYYKQMIANSHIPDVDTFNSLLAISGFLKEGSDMKWKLVLEVLNQMAACDIRPNVRTLNAIMETISTIPMYKAARELALQTLAEFKSIGILPSLATYFHLLNVFYREKGPTTLILREVIDQLEHEVPELQDLKDVFFFVRAMEICDSHLGDASLARRIHALLSKSSNQIFIGDSFKESVYYRHYLQLLSRTESAESLMETYNIIVPNIYTPETSVFKCILENLTEQSATHYIAQLYTDATYMELLNKEGILEKLVEGLASGVPLDSNQHHSENDISILNTARAIWGEIEDRLKSYGNEEQPRNPLHCTGSMLGNLIKVFVQLGDLETACLIMNVLNASKNKITGFVPANILKIFLSSCLKENKVPFSLMTVNYACEIGFPETMEMAKEVANKMVLDSEQQFKLNAMVGQDLFKKS